MYLRQDCTGSKLHCSAGLLTGDCNDYNMSIKIQYTLTSVTLDRQHTLPCSSSALWSERVRHSEGHQGGTDVRPNWVTARQRQIDSGQDQKPVSGISWRPGLLGPDRVGFGRYLRFSGVRLRLLWKHVWGESATSGPNRTRPPRPGAPAGVTSLFPLLPLALSLSGSSTYGRLCKTHRVTPSTHTGFKYQ